MSNILLVPVHLDALVLDHDQMVVDSTADFSRLPYCTGKYDINPDIANVSEELVSTPFQSENLLLKAGIHLHWSLPDALTKAIPDASGRQQFPLVPNRWLVTRLNKSDVIQKQWLVESDYLHPRFPTTDLLAASVVDGVAMPFHQGAGQPFRFMGQKIDVTGVSRVPRDPQAEYYPQLTAVGYGEPTFAAFYPNCFSVFGFFDDDYSGKRDERRYYVNGWYANPDDDVLRTHVRDAKTLKDSFKWTITPEGQEFPTRMVCYAKLTLGEEKLRLKNQRVTIAVGNTGTEALSACLGHNLLGAKGIVEDHLEAMHLAPELENRQLDVGAKLAEARHEKGFKAVRGGTLWTVVAVEPTPRTAADATDTPAEISLPYELGSLLNVLNQQQSKYDRELQQIESMRIQLFSDWYKYMLCAYPPEDTRDAYPDIDDVKSYVANRAAALNRYIARTGKIVLNETDTRVVASVDPGANPSSRTTTAHELATIINNLQSFIDTHSDKPTFQLKQTSGPRYWVPTEPSILLEGELAKPSARHGQDAPGKTLLETHLLAVANANDDPSEKSFRDAIRQKIIMIGRNAGTDKNFAITTWTEQPWNPFLLEWEVEVFPVANKSNIDPLTGQYDEDFITDNYQLAENDVDLSFKQNRGKTTSAANLYRGRSILTPHASTQLVEQTESYLEKEVLPKFYSQSNVSAPRDDRDYLTRNMDQIERWYKATLLKAGGPDKERDPNMTAFGAWRAMRNPESQSQSLSGFNDALLMQKQTPQLDVADPLGFEDYVSFATGIEKAVSDSIYSAPAPQSDFNPIRSGMMKIHRLRLVDTFGQIKDLNVDKILISDPLEHGTAVPTISLPPRLMQPARVNFRWLAADADEEEMNDHPATTPICGWVLANNLDASLMIYDNAGRALGSVVKKDGKATWATAPGGLGISSEKEISNPHLRKMVRTVLDWGAKFLDDFITTIDSALENIEPENFARHQDLALLMGRPLALVRASVNLELKGLPAVHQGWNEFRQDMHRDGRDDNGFTRVRFPIRIGEYSQFNDGTVGYWKENDGEYEDNAFFAPQSDDDGTITDKHIKTHNTNPEAMVFYQTVESPPQLLSLLIDPRGLVHATTGVVPVKAINIPPDQYAAALQAIEITFLSTPLLTDAGKIHLPLPDEAGYQWSWLQQDLDHHWSEVSTRGLVHKKTFVEAFGNAAGTVWDELLDRVWIKLIDEKDQTRASVTAKDKRKREPLSVSVQEKVGKIEDILDRAHIGPVDPTAKFAGQQEIREGWLKLSSASDTQSLRKNLKP